jgi:RimJ/RimL family protein N-acetyltransferase
MIQTERLLLRKYASRDLEFMLDLGSDASNRRYVGNLPSTEEEAWSRLLRIEGHWSFFGHGTYAVVDRSTDLVVGEVGAGSFRRGIDKRLDDIPEASWLFNDVVRGKGYAFEATSALMRWLDETKTYPNIACLIEPSNLPSLRLAGKLGFTTANEVRYRDLPFVLFFRTRQI